MAAREAEINERFQLCEKARFDLEKKVTKLVEDKSYSVQSDLTVESKNRMDSIEHIKGCLKQDFPRLEEMIRRE